MTLDEWQKITDISVKGVVAAAIAGVTLWYTAQRFDTDKSKLCTESLDQTFQMVVRNKFSDAYKSMLDWRIRAHEQVCGELSEKMVTMLNNAWQPPDILADAGQKAITPPDPKPEPGRTPAGTVETGQPATETPSTYRGPLWVATSRRNDNSYSAINFDVRQGDQSNPNKVGNIIAARWFVNIRTKNTPVSRGDNPVVGQLVGGDCARIVEHVQGTLNEWARVERAACPAGNG